MKTFTFNKWVEDLLKAKTQQEEETCGYLVYMKGQYTPNETNEGIVPVETGTGLAGHVTTKPKIENAVTEALSQNQKLGGLEFHVHSLGTMRLNPKWGNSLSNFGDMPYIRQRIEQDPNFQHLFVTPSLYAFVYANPNFASGLGAVKHRWGSAPIRTSFDDIYDREALAKSITKAINEELKR
jgi:hypothetical protein